MSIHQIPMNDAIAIKAACHELADRCGGVTALSAAVRLSPARVSEGCSPHHMDRWLSILHVAEAEVVAGEPLVARCLADLAGYDLVPRPGTVKAKTVHAHLSSIMHECTDVQSGIVAALADGSLSQTERTAITAEINQTIEAMNALKTDMQPRGGLKAVTA